MVGDEGEVLLVVVVVGVEVEEDVAVRGRNPGAHAALHLEGWKVGLRRRCGRRSGSRGRRGVEGRLGFDGRLGASSGEGDLGERALEEWRGRRLAQQLYQRIVLEVVHLR